MRHLCRECCECERRDFAGIILVTSCDGCGKDWVETVEIVEDEYDACRQLNMPPP